MAAQPMSEEIKKEHIKGKYGIVQASITAGAALLAAIIAGVVTYRVGVMQLKTDSAQGGNEAEDRIMALEQRLADLHEEVLALERDKKQLQSDYEIEQKDNARLQSENAKLQNDYESAQSEINDLRSQLGNPAPNGQTAIESMSTTESTPGNTQSDSIQIPQDAVYRNGHAYKAYSESLTWTNAKLYCESLGGHLVTITDIQESLFLRDYLITLESPMNSYWIGLFYDGSPKQWNWVTGEAYSFKNWQVSQPDNWGGVGEDSGFLLGKNYGSGYLGEWGDAHERGDSSPDNYFYFENIGLICEWDAS